MNAPTETIVGIPVHTCVKYALEGVVSPPTPLQIEEEVPGCLPAGVEVVSSTWHRFEGGGEGITYLAALSSSGLIIHTWPERDFMLIEVSICRDLRTLDLVEMGAKFETAFGGKVMMDSFLYMGKDH